MSTVFVTGRLPRRELDGTTHVLDAGKVHGMRRVVALSIGTRSPTGCEA